MSVVARSSAPITTRYGILLHRRWDDLRSFASRRQIAIPPTPTIAIATGCYEHWALHNGQARGSRSAISCSRGSSFVHR